MKSLAIVIDDGYYMAYKPNHNFMYLVYIHWNEIYLLSFLCDFHNEVYEHIND